MPTSTTILHIEGDSDVVVRLTGPYGEAFSFDIRVSDTYREAKIWIFVPREKLSEFADALQSVVDEIRKAAPSDVVPEAQVEGVVSNAS